MICNVCEQEFDDDELFTINGKSYCRECAEEEYIQCEYCGRWVEKDNAQYIQDEQVYYCNTCAGRLCYQCVECGDYYYNNGEGERDENGDWYCSGCADTALRCHVCNCIVASEDYYNCGNIVCANCYEENCAIYDYHDDNVEYYPQRLDGEGRYDRTFGFELEVSGERYYAKDLINILGDDAVCMNDSSIIDGGFEIVTMPMTKGYFYEKFLDKWKKGLNFLIDKGFRGHNKGGLHIHFSCNRINGGQLAQLAEILYGNEEDIKTWQTISQRKRETLRRWASMENREYSFESIKDACDPIGEDRYTALNYDDRTDTYEMRIFNSNLRIERFLKNFECVLALLDYTEIYKNEDEPICTTKGFIKYVHNNKLKYPNLQAFLIEKDLPENYGQDYIDNEQEAA